MPVDVAAFNPVVFEIGVTGLFVLGLLVYLVAGACRRWANARAARREELARLRDVDRAAREVDAFVSPDGPPFRFDGRSPSDEAQRALLSLHDYLNDVARVREEAGDVRHA